MLYNMFSKTIRTFVVLNKRIELIIVLQNVKNKKDGNYEKEFKRKHFNVAIPY